MPGGIIPGLRLSESGMASANASFHRIMAAALSISLAIAASTSLLAAEKDKDEETVKVGKIEIVRPSRASAVTDRQILANMEIKAGTSYPLQKYLMIADSDVKRLFRKGIAVKSWEPASPKGEFALRIVVEERLIIGKVDFEGADDLDEEDVRKEVEAYLSVNAASDESFVKFACGKIRAFYQSKGFRFAQVSYDIYPMSAGRTHVVVRIIEGPRPKIAEIRFRGAAHFTKSDLLESMETDESGLFSSEYYDEEKFADDIKAVEQFYREEGYRNARVCLEDIAYNASLDRMIIIVRVEEGPRFKIGKIGVKGCKFFDEAKIRKEIKTRTGDWYRRVSIDGDRKKDEKGDLKRIKDIYGAEGFLFTRITTRESFDLENLVVDMTYDISEGERIKLGKILFRNNFKTRDDVLRRCVLLTPGDYPSLSDIEDTMRILFNTKYFKDLNIGWEDTEDPAVKDLVFELEETTMGDIRFILGYSASTSLTGKIQLQFNNFDLGDFPESFDDLISGNAFVGGGQTLRMGFTIGMERQMVYSIDFYEPSFFGTDTSIKVAGSKSQRDYGSYLQRSMEGMVEFGHRFGRYLRVSAGYDLKEVELRDISLFSPPDVFEARGPSLISSLQFGVTFANIKDDMMQPYEGYSIGLSYEYAGGFLLGDVDYSKASFRLDLFNTLWNKPILFFIDPVDKYRQILSFKLQIDWAEPHGGQKSLPIYERFYAGGLQSIRGFEFRGIGPKWGSESIGGNFRAMTTLEYSIPLFRTPFMGGNMKIDLLRLVFFYDACALVPSLEDFSTSQIRSSIGFGFRLRVPAMGGIPISLDFGFPLARLPGDESERVSFSIGLFFF